MVREYRQRLLTGFPVRNPENLARAKRLVAPGGHIADAFPPPPEGGRQTTCQACKGIMWLDRDAQQERLRIVVAGRFPAIICLLCIAAACGARIGGRAAELAGRIPQQRRGD